jgi:type II secretory pathway component PulF
VADFEYIAIDKKGKTRNGSINAPDPKAARRKIMQSGLTVLKIKMSGDSTSRGANQASPKEKKESSLKNKFSSKGEAIGLEFLKRLLELHGSGMPVADAVKLLNYRLSDPQQKSLSGVLWKELAEGRTLSRAMRHLPGYFSESSTYVIEAGEATGNLAPILSKIISHLEEKREIRSRVMSGMTYPLFVGLMAIGVVLFFLFFLLPQIQEMLASLGEN